MLIVLQIKDQKRLFIPTRVSSQRKLSIQIRQYYAANIKDCSMGSIRESVFGEEAIASRKTILEKSRIYPFGEVITYILIRLLYSIIL